MPIFPLLYSYSTKDSFQCSNFPNHEPLSSKTLTNVGDFKFGEEFEPNTMIYFNAMLMKEDIDDKLWMGLECTSYLGTQKKFAKLIGGKKDYNNCKNESLDIDQLSKEIFEDRLVHEYGNMLCENDSQSNPDNHYNTIVPNHTYIQRS